MEIEQRLHGIESDPKFREMRSNLNLLETNIIGSRHIKIGSPENLNRMIELRRSSVEMDEVIKLYKDGLEKYSNRIEELNKEKKRLQEELFPIK